MIFPVENNETMMTDENLSEGQLSGMNICSMNFLAAKIRDIGENTFIIIVIAQ